MCVRWRCTATVGVWRSPVVRVQPSMRHPPRVEPAPGQESVWDYPRPPLLQSTPRHLVVEAGGRVIAETRHGARVLETSHPPVYYFPPGDVAPGVLASDPRSRSHCEWKGGAQYFDVVVDGRRWSQAAWCYPAPVPAFAQIRGWVAFYAGRVDRCFVDGEEVTPQPGAFYGGWITRDLAGPFKGGPGSGGW